MPKFKDRDSGPSFGDRTNLLWDKDVSVQTETLSDMGTSVSTITDVQTFLEAVAVVINSVGSLVDAKVCIENLLSTITSVGSITAIQTYVDTLASVAQSVSSLTDLQAYTITLADLGTSSSAILDVLSGLNAETLIDVILSQAGVYDYYKKAGMAETTITFYMAARRDFQINARPAAFTIERAN